MLKIEAYTILAGFPQVKSQLDWLEDHLSSLEEQVTTYIAEGWRIHGTPFVYETAVCQAMVKFANI